MGGMGEEEIVIMYHYIEDKVFLKDMKYCVHRSAKSARPAKLSSGSA